MNRFTHIAIILLKGLVIGTFLAFSFKGVVATFCPQKDVLIRDTLLIRDTIVVDKPYAIKERVVKYIKVPVYKRVIEKDSILDSTSIELPITQKEYRDSSYVAWVSGYEANLDSIRIFRPKYIIRERVAGETAKPGRWSISLQGGYGITPKGMLPYIGIGVSYRLNR